MASPLKHKPDRLPGQALNEYRQEFIEEKIFTPFLFAYFFSVFFVWEWIRYFFAVPPHPKTVTVAALIGVSYCAFLIRKNLKKDHLLVQGIEGERTVGLFLEEALRPCDCSILHDIQNEKGNIDHVLVCTKGIFTIETKTWGKKHKDSKIEFDGMNLLINGFPSRKPINQAKAEAAALKNILEERMGRTFVVRPTILFPEWFIDKKDMRLLLEKEGIWLLNPKALPAFVKNQPKVLTQEEVVAIISSLKNYSRAERS